jgi:hypothetical protein
MLNSMLLVAIWYTPKGLIHVLQPVVKGIRVSLIDMVAHCDNLPILCGHYIGKNMFIAVDCSKKANSQAGPE